MEYRSNSPEETFALGKRLGEQAKAGEIYCLDGDLGVGKTIFTQGFAAGLGIEEPVNSPTFTIVQQYDSGRLSLYHFDVYRIGDVSEMDEIGYEDCFYGEGVCLIEWSQLIPEILGIVMKILGIESSSLVASVAVVTDGLVTAEYTVNFKKTHSQTLLPMIDEVTRMLELDLNDVDAIAVSGGPGSYTGLRIGSATAKGLGLALNKPLVHVPTMDAMAYNLYGSSALICPVMDARRGQVYTGLYHYEDAFEVVKPQCGMDIHELIGELNARGERVIFLGDGVPVNETVIRETMTVPFSFAPAQCSRQRGASVAALGSVYFAEGKTVSAMDHAPDYLRKAQAERELEEAKRQGKMDELAAGHSVGTGDAQ